MANGQISGPPAADFYSMLSGLGDTLNANAKLRQQQQTADARKAAFTDFTALDPASPDYGKQAITIAQKLGSAGDQDGAVKFIGLAQTAADRARQTSRDAVTDRHWQKSYDLSARAAARADDKTPTNFVADASVPGGYRPIGPADPDYQALLARKKAEAEASVPGAGGASLNPVYGVGADGKPAMVQTTKTGKAIQTELPSGFQISKEPIKVDNGTYYTLIDPQTRQPVGTLPKNLAAVEVQKAEGEATGAAQVNLPTVIANSQQILKTLDTIENHPGKKYALGMGSKVPTIPGTSQADFRANLEQLGGQGFLQVYQTLKGGGAITDIEGQKGQNALMRMQTAQSQESFDQGLKDFKDVVKTGMLRASAKARGPGSQNQGITQQQYEALPSGSPFTAPDGSQRIKP